MENQELVKQLCDDVGKIKDALVGTLEDPCKEGLITRVCRLERFYSLLAWFSGICTVAIVSGCVAYIVK